MGVVFFSLYYKMMFGGRLISDISDLIGSVKRWVAAAVDCWLLSVHHSPLLFNQEVKDEGEMVHQTSIIFFGPSLEVIPN